MATLKPKTHQQDKHSETRNESHRERKFNVGCGRYGRRFSVNCRLTEENQSLRSSMPALIWRYHMKRCPRDGALRINVFIKDHHGGVNGIKPIEGSFWQKKEGTQQQQTTIITTTNYYNNINHMES